MTAVAEGICRAPQAALHYEWLETNGRGGYASSTILNCHTRKYHSLLMAALDEPPGRFSLLSKLEDSVVHGGTEHFLSRHQYPGVLHPAGNAAELVQFEHHPHPSFLHRADGIVIRTGILMVAGENTTLIRYDAVQAPAPFFLRLKPLLPYRGLHEVRRKDDWMDRRSWPVPNGFGVRPYTGLPPLFVQSSVPPAFASAPAWYFNFEYHRERERGYDWQEDLFCPGVMDIALAPGESVVIAASLAPIDAPLQRLWDGELAKRIGADRADEDAARAAIKDSGRAATFAALAKSGRRFLIRTPRGRPAIIAGYPWFDDWSRDTLISLPGLTFCSGRVREGLAILKSIGEHERDGLLPNYFAADPRHNSYNSVDAPLWYFWAAQQLLACTNDPALVRDSCWPVLKRILARFMEGTPGNVAMSPSGLLQAGSPSTQLTWMDAMVAGTPVTPRYGYAVELNALWYNALRFSETLALQFGERLWPDRDLTERLRTEFLRTFWIEEDGYLADTAGADGRRDVSFRPNQIMALSLPFALLDAARGRRMIEAVKDRLLTPFGLRTLAPHSAEYRGRYEGDQSSRDAAYHQGTVWPWLLGHFAEAFLRVAPDRKTAAGYLLDTVAPLLDYSLGAGLDNVPEIFDGDPPHRPNGCMAQAWSTGELIRFFTLCSPETWR